MKMLLIVILAVLIKAITSAMAAIFVMPAHQAVNQSARATGAAAPQRSIADHP